MNMFDSLGKGMGSEEVDISPTPETYRSLLRQIVAFGQRAEDKKWAIAEAERVKDVEDWGEITPDTYIIGCYRRTTGRQFGGANEGEL